MISYSDYRFHSAGADPRFGANSHRLGDRLLGVSGRYGDTVHTSGRADYVIRMLENFPSPEEELPSDVSCFAIAAGPRSLQILVKRGSEHGSLTAEVEFDSEESWMQEVERLFVEFRESLTA